MKHTYKCEECPLEEVVEAEVEHAKVVFRGGKKYDADTGDVIEEEPDRLCKECGNKMYKKIIGSCNFILKGKSGFRSTGERDSNWDYSKKRHDPREGHRMTADERKAVEDRIVNKQVKKWDDYAKGVKPLSKVLPKALNKMKGDKV